MSTAERLERVRRWLLLLAAGLFAGTVVELIAVKHYEELLQLVPFALCVLGLVATALIAVRSTAIPLNVLRAFLLVNIAGSLLGIWEHIEGNYAFVHDLRPHAATSELLRSAVNGSNPLLAPGTLALGAFLVVVASFAAERAPVTAPLPRGARTAAADGTR